MGLQRTVKPTVEPVDKQEAKAHSRVTVSEDDAYIDTLIEAARERAEEHTKRALVTQTWQLKMSQFPAGRGDIILPRPPLQSVSSITYVDSNGDTQTLSSASYVVDTSSEPGRVRLAYGVQWPVARTTPNGVTVTYVAGYGSTAESVPALFKHFIKVLVGHLYDNREPVVTGTVAAEIPHTLYSLIASYRVMEASS